MEQTALQQRPTQQLLTEPQQQTPARSTVQQEMARLFTFVKVIEVINCYANKGQCMHRFNFVLGALKGMTN